MIFFDTLRQGLWVAVAISMPILTVRAPAGLIVGLFQALTSIQEMTLTFVPKLAAIVAVFWVSMSFMTQTLTRLFHRHAAADHRRHVRAMRWTVPHMSPPDPPIRPDARDAGGGQ
jgi:flagellar biosynthetic protein FliQ